MEGFLTRYDEFKEKPNTVNSYFATILQKKKISRHQIMDCLKICELYFYDLKEHERVGITMRKVFYKLEQNLQQKYNQERELLEKLVNIDSNYINKEKNEDFQRIVDG